MPNNDAFNRGFAENTYTGNGSDWVEWQRGQMMRQEAERRRREQEKEAERMRNPSALPGYMPAPAIPATVSTMTPDEALTVFRFVFRVLTLPIVLAAAIMALFAAPMMGVVEKLFRSEEHLDFGEAYRSTYKSTYAWGLTTVVSPFTLDILGNYLPPLWSRPSIIIHL